MQRKRVISSGANKQTSPKARQLLVYCSFGVTAGVLAGLLGVGGGAVMGPMFLELGIPPQVKSLFDHVKGVMFQSMFLTL